MYLYISRVFVCVSIRGLYEHKNRAFISLSFIQGDALDRVKLNLAWSGV